jgi:hypothetical protein
VREGVEHGSYETTNVILTLGKTYINCKNETEKFSEQRFLSVAIKSNWNVFAVSMTYFKFCFKITTLK